MVTVFRGGNNSEPINVNYAPSDGTATAGADYQASTGTLTFAPGENAKELVIPILEDGFVENTESFEVNLRNPSAGILLGAQASAGSGRLVILWPWARRSNGPSQT